MIKCFVIWNMKRQVKMMEKQLKYCDEVILKLQDYQPFAKEADEVRKRYNFVYHQLQIHKTKIKALQNNSDNGGRR